MNPVILESKDLHLYYGETEALKGIDMKIYQNEITALIGPSGCGKSTFLKTLNRMNDLVPNVRITGDVTLKGKNILDKDVDVTKLRRQVGMVFQKANPFPMSIYDNIAYGPRLHGEHSKVQLDELVENALRGAALWDEVKDRLKKSALGLSGGQQQRLCIARALAVQPDILLMDEPTSALDLWDEVKDRLKKSALGLSGGQQQRLCIARALAVQPDILLMDEPTSALDPGSTLRIEDLMAELKKDYTVVIVTHNMQQASRISDRTAFFLLGELIEYGETSQIFTNPAEKKTEEYITGRFG